MKKIFFLLVFISCMLPVLSCNNSRQDIDADDGRQPHVCEFVIESPERKYIKYRSTCTKRAEYYLSCSCGNAGEETFEYGNFASHVYAIKSTLDKYLVKEATVKTPAVYYKSCKCGQKGEATFEYGTPIQLSDVQKACLPTSLTMSLYDSQALVYGFTYNTLATPVSPVLQIKQVGENEWLEYLPTTYEAQTRDSYDNKITYYVSKVEVALLPETEYVYRVCDKGADVATPESIFRTGNPRADSFTFAHVSDSQDGPEEFGRVMWAISDSSDFAIHTGDVVQYPKYNHLWQAMIDDNYEYMMKIPVMAISGNHEAGYTDIGFQTVDHFNYALPEQSSLELGCYYSFVYGNVKFIMLDTNDLEDNRLKSDQYEWLISELDKNTCKWTIVSMHNPMYSVGKYGADPTRNGIALALREQLGEVFARYGVDLVLQAHDHAVSKTFPIDGDGIPRGEETEMIDGVEYIVNPEGVIYLMNGPAGTQQRSPVAIDGSLYSYAETGKKASFAQITVADDTITVTVKWMNGYSEEIYHTWGIKKQ